MIKLSCYLAFITIIFNLIACNKSADTTVIPPVIPPVITDTPMVQYRTPFSAVPDRRDAVIYQVNMRVFSPSESFQSITDRLDSIKSLGVNVIYLMPIYPVGILNAFNSPYCVKDYNAVNPEFGSLTDLRKLVDSAHAKKMAVILDWVANHTSWDNSWITNKSWYLQDANGNILSPPGMGWNDVAQLNFNNNDMRLAMIKAMKSWVYKTNIDGFRCDYAAGPPSDFWQQAIDTLRNISTHKLLLLAEGNNPSNFTVGFDFNFGFNFFYNLKSVYSANTSILSINNLNTSEYTSATGTQQVVRYTSNHDVDGSDGTPLQLFGGRNGSLASFVIVACMKSVPMIYNGQEVGTPVRFTFPFVGQTIDWSINPDIKAEYKRILAFRNSSVAIRQGSLTTYSTTDVCAFTKQQATDSVLIIDNLRNSVINYNLPAALSNTTWIDAFSNQSVSLNTQLILQPYTYLLLKK